MSSRAFLLCLLLSPLENCRKLGFIKPLYTDRFTTEEVLYVPSILGIDMT